MCGTHFHPSPSPSFPSLAMVWLRAAPRPSSRRPLLVARSPPSLRHLAPPARSAAQRREEFCADASALAAPGSSRREVPRCLLRHGRAGELAPRRSSCRGGILQAPKGLTAARGRAPDVLAAARGRGSAGAARRSGITEEHAAGAVREGAGPHGRKRAWRGREMMAMRSASASLPTGCDDMAMRIDNQVV